jgi:hypothetical protein
MIQGDTEKIKALYRRYLWARDTRDTYRRPEWELASKYIAPAHGRFLTSRDNIPAKGKVDRNSIINGTGSRALAIAVAGIKGGLVPHSLKWFKLGLYDEDLENHDPVKDYLHACERIMYSVFNRSNFYEAVYMPFHEQLTFGTGPLQVNEHPERVIHCDPWTIGEYTLANGPDNMVDTGFRDRWVTLRAVEKRFGHGNMSPRLLNMLKNNPDQFIRIIQCVMPRQDYDPNKRDNLNMPWASVWFEEGKGAGEAILGESGYQTQPVMYPRWMTVGEDPYGSDCPGLAVLGDILQLQRMEKDKLSALAKMVDPPMNVPSNLFGRLKLYPGAQNPVNEKENEQVKQTITMNYNTENIRQEIRDVESRIREGFFNDLFLMIIQGEKSGTTAYEIAKKNEEKLALLGPVVERQNAELLNPVIDRVFDICYRRGMFPDPPQALQEEGAEIRVEYVSLLAQAQKAVGITGLERTLSTIGNLVQLFPEIRHKVDAMKVVDEVASLQGMNPLLLRSNEEAMRRHEAEQEAMAQQQQAMQAVEGARAAKDLSGASMQGDNALNRLMDQLPAV